MATTRRRPGGGGARPSAAVFFGLGIAAFLLVPSCGGQSIRYEEDPDETPEVGGSGFGADTGGGVAGTNGFGGSSIPTGGVGNAPSGGVPPTGGTGPFGGVAGFGGGGGFGGVGVVGGFNPGGFAGFGAFNPGGFNPGGFGGFNLGGTGGRGRGMGGRVSGGRGFGGRGFGGFGGFSGVGGSGGFAANPIDGFAFLTTCTADTLDRWCYLSSVCQNPDPSLPGIHPMDVTVMMPGTPGVLYDMAVRVQGLVESKTYAGGTDQDGYSSIQPADGFYSGGAPTLTASSTYLVRVTSPARDYYLNSISPPTMSSVAPPTWVDYRATIRVEGGTTVRLVSADSDCAVLRNCGSQTSSSDCNPVTVPNLVPAIAVHLPAQPYDGQFLGIVVESVTQITF